MRGDGERSRLSGIISTIRSSFWLWYRFSLRRIVTDPARSAMAFIAVALAATLVSAVLRVSLASIDSFERGISMGDRPYHVLVSPVGGNLELSRYASCLRELSSKAEVLALKREAGVASVDGKTKAVRIAALYLFSLESDEISTPRRLVSTEIAAELGVSDFKTISLTTSDGTFDLEVYRASKSDTIPAQSDLMIALSDLGQAKSVDTLALRFYQYSGSKAKVDSNGRDGRDIDTTSKDLVNLTRSWLSSCSADITPLRVEPVEAPIERGEQLLSAYRFNILIMAAITAIVCAILISQATQIALRGLIRELAILRTLGASPLECLALVVIEASVVSLLGSLLGLTLGAPIVARISGFLSSTAGEIYNVALFQAEGRDSLWNTTLVAICMTGLGALAALIGAKKVLVLPPYRGTRREQRQIHKIEQKLAVLSASIGVVSVAGFLMALVYFERPVLAYLSIAAILLGAALALPLFLEVIPRLLAYFNRILSIRLAACAVRESGFSFLLSAVAATVSIALMVGLALMVSSFRETLRSWSNTRLAGDVFISSSLSGSGNDARVERGLDRELEGISAVKRVIPYFETTTSSFIKPTVVGGVDLKTQCLRGVYRFTSGSCVSGNISWQGRALISENAVRKLGLNIGSRLKLEDRYFEAVGIVQEFGTESPLIVIDRGDFESIYPNHYPESLTIDLKDVVDLEGVKSLLKARLPETLIIRDQRELLELVETLFNRTFRVTDSVRWIVFVLALLGLVSTGAQYIWERRRELKIAEVLGVTPKTLTLSLVVETALISATATFVGVLAGIGIGWCLTDYINPLMFGWSLVFKVSLEPVLESAAFLSAVIVASGLVSYLMIRKIVTSCRLEDE